MGYGAQAMCELAHNLHADLSLISPTILSNNPRISPLWQGIFQQIKGFPESIVGELTARSPYGPIAGHAEGSVDHGAQRLVIYIYIYIYLSLSLYIYIYICMYIYIYLSIYLSLSLSIYIYTYTYIYIYLSIYISIYISISLSLYIYIYIYRSFCCTCFALGLCWTPSGGGEYILLCYVVLCYYIMLLSLQL